MVLIDGIKYIEDINTKKIYHYLSEEDLRRGFKPLPKGGA